MSLFPTDTFRFPTDLFRRPAALARFILPMVLGLALDLWVKDAAFTTLADAPPHQVLRENPRKGTSALAWAVNLKDRYAFPQNVAPRTVESFPFADDVLRNDARGGEIVTAMGGYPLIIGWVHFTVAVNEGAALGIGQGWRTLFILISVAAIAFLTYLFAHSGRHRLYQIILGLLLAGVLGNMYDRIAYSYVRDMIRVFPRWPSLFPWVFNVADMLLCCGVGYMLLSFLFVPQPAAAPPSPPSSSPPSPPPSPSSEDEERDKHLKVWT